MNRIWLRISGFLSASATAIILIVFLGLCILMPRRVEADWAPYDFFPVGAKGMGAGGAFTSLADDLGAFHANPAGLVQVQKPALSYQIYSVLQVQRLIDTSLQLRWEYFPLLAYAFPFSETMTGGMYVQTLFKSQLESYNVHGIGFSWSWSFTDRLAVGLNTGIAIANQQDNWAFGWYVQSGMLFMLSREWRFGAIVRFPINLEWDALRGDADVQERLPWSSQFGVSWRLRETSILSFELEYQGWSAIRYSAAGSAAKPDFESGLFKTWHPHIGFHTLHEPTGAQVRIGFMTAVTASSGGLESMPVLTLGLGAFTTNYFRLDFALLDTLIFDIFTRTDRFERFLISFEYSF